MDEPKVKEVVIRLCEACLSGVGDECHTPGCALFLHNSPGHPIAPELYQDAKPLTDALQVIADRSYNYAQEDMAGLVAAGIARDALEAVKGKD